jgi:hypothetical protein
MPRINITGSNNPQHRTAKYAPQFDAYARARAAKDAAWEGAYDQRAREAKRRSSAEYQRYLDEQARAERAGAEQVAAHNREAEALVRRNAARMRALEDLRYRSEKSYEQAQWKRLGDSGYRARIRNHGHSCFLCEIVIRSQFHTTYEPEA